MEGRFAADLLGKVANCHVYGIRRLAVEFRELGLVRGNDDGDNRRPGLALLQLLLQAGAATVTRAVIWSKCVATYLHIPPPSSGVHIEVDSDGVVCVGVVALRGEHEDPSKLGIPVQSANALDDVAVEDLEGFASDDNLAACEAGTSRRELLVDDVVEFLRVFE